MDYFQTFNSFFMHNLKRQCRYCGSVIFGRADKKFCGDGCRSSFNNGRKGERDDEIKAVNTTLFRNRKILSQILEDGVESVRILKDRMSLLGFNFRYHTHITPFGNNMACLYCYDYGYIDLGNSRLLVVREMGEKDLENLIANMQLFSLENCL